MNRKWTILLISFLFLGLMLNLIPLAWMLSTSLKSSGEVFSMKWIPESLRFENYMRVFEMVPFGRYYLNSIIVSVGVTLITLFLCSTAGFAFAKIKFPGRNILFLLFLSTLMIPFHVIMIPLYEVVSFLGWIDTYQGLILPQITVGFGVFLMRQFMLSVPDDILDAAKVDGASMLYTFFKIVLPIQRPGLATVAIFTFNTSWNNLLWPLLSTTSPEMSTLPVGMALFSDSKTVDWPALMAGSLLTVLPMIIFFIFMQKQFIRGLTSGAVKE